MENNKAFFRSSYKDSCLKKDILQKPIDTFWTGFRPHSRIKVGKSASENCFICDNFLANFDGSTGVQRSLLNWMCLNKILKMEMGKVDIGEKG